MFAGMAYKDPLWILVTGMVHAPAVVALPWTESSVASCCHSLHWALLAMVGLQLLSLRLVEQHTVYGWHYEHQQRLRDRVTGCPLVCAARRVACADHAPVGQYQPGRWFHVAVVTVVGARRCRAAAEADAEGFTCAESNGIAAKCFHQGVVIREDSRAEAPKAVRNCLGHLMLACFQHVTLIKYTKG